MTFIRFIIVFIFIFTGISSAFAEDAPYKATTEEECIQEQECFLYHLLWALQITPNTQKPTQLIDFNKWEKPVRIRIFNDQKMTEELFRFIDDRIVELSGSVTQESTYEQKYNFAIIKTTSIEKELTQSYKEPFDQALGKGIAHQLYKNVKNSGQGNKTCFFLRLTEKEQSSLSSIASYFIFVEHSDPDVQKCLTDSIYSAFGLYRLNHSPLFSKSKYDYRYSRLEKLIMYLIYQDFFKSGMTYEQVESVFFQVYPKFIEHVNKNKILTGN